MAEDLSADCSSGNVFAGDFFAALQLSDCDIRGCKVWFLLERVRKIRGDRIA